jgi:hypothetical protein
MTNSELSSSLFDILNEVVAARAILVRAEEGVDAASKELKTAEVGPYLVTIDDHKTPQFRAR